MDRYMPIRVWEDAHISRPCLSLKCHHAGAVNYEIRPRPSNIFWFPCIVCESDFSEIGLRAKFWKLQSASASVEGDAGTQGALRRNVQLHPKLPLVVIFNW